MLNQIEGAIVISISSQDSIQVQNSFSFCFLLIDEFFEKMIILGIQEEDRESFNSNC